MVAFGAPLHRAGGAGRAAEEAGVAREDRIQVIVAMLSVAVPVGILAARRAVAGVEAAGAPADRFFIVAGEEEAWHFEFGVDAKEPGEQGVASAIAEPVLSSGAGAEGVGRDREEGGDIDWDPYTALP